LPWDKTVKEYSNGPILKKNFASVNNYEKSRQAGTDKLTFQLERPSIKVLIIRFQTPAGSDREKPAEIACEKALTNAGSGMMRGRNSREFNTIGARSAEIITSYKTDSYEI